MFSLCLLTVFQRDCKHSCFPVLLGCLLIARGARDNGRKHNILPRIPTSGSDKVGRLRWSTAQIVGQRKRAYFRVTSGDLTRVLERAESHSTLIHFFHFVNFKNFPCPALLPKLFFLLLHRFLLLHSICFSFWEAQMCGFMSVHARKTQRDET